MLEFIELISELKKGSNGQKLEILDDARVQSGEP